MSQNNLASNATGYEMENRFRFPAEAAFLRSHVQTGSETHLQVHKAAGDVNWELTSKCRGKKKKNLETLPPCPLYIFMTRHLAMGTHVPLPPPIWDSCVVPSTKFYRTLRATSHIRNK